MNFAKISIILVHGAWHKNSVWTAIAKLFTAIGHDVRFPNFFGHGNNEKPLDQISFEDYVSTLRSEIEKAPHPVILIGHSSAGLLLQEVLGLPKVILYIFINAFAVPVGTCQFDHVPPDAAGFMKMLANARPDRCVPVLDQKFNNEHKIPVEPFVESKLMAGENPDITKKLIEEELVPQPLALFITPVTKDPKTPCNKMYLFSADDVSLPPGAFVAMAGLLDAEVFITSGGHECIFTNPNLIFECLLKMINDKLS